MCLWNLCFEEKFVSIFSISTSFKHIQNVKKSGKETVNAYSAIKHFQPSMFRRRSHLSHLCKWWKTYRGYWPFNNEHDLLNINHKLYQRVSSFFDNEHKRTTSALHYKTNDFLRYQLIIITIILQIIIKFPGKQYPL